MLIANVLFLIFTINASGQNSNARKNLTDEICEKLSLTAQQKSRELGVEISFAIADEAGVLRLFRRFGNALPLSVTLVPGKAYTSAVTRTKTEDLTKAVSDGGDLYGINTADSRITVVTGGFPLIADGKVIGAIGVGGGTKEQDRLIGEFVVLAFENLSEE